MASDPTQRRDEEQLHLIIGHKAHDRRRCLQTPSYPRTELFGRAHGLWCFAGGLRVGGLEVKPSRFKSVRHLFHTVM